MANQYHLNILRKGTVLWNEWRKENQNIQPDLSGAELNVANLSRANLSEANLSRADLVDANLILADLSGADLTIAALVRTNLREAILIGSYVYGISAWDVRLEGAKQANLITTLPQESTITVDTIEVAQLIHQWLNNKNIQTVIDATTKKVVLILGRFTPERKVVLDAIKKALRKYDYLPVLFDFKKPDNQELTGTVMTLAHLSRFIIADVTDPSSVPYELGTIVPSLKTVPIQPLLEEAKKAFGLFDNLKGFPWFLPEHLYKDLEDLLGSFKEKVIDPAENKANQLINQIAAKE